MRLHNWCEMVQGALCLCILLGLAGCTLISTHSVKTVDIGRNIHLSLTNPPNSLHEQERLQLITFEFEGEAQSLLLATTFRKDGVGLVAMSLQSIPLFELTFSEGKPLEVQQYMPLSFIEPRYIVADLQMVHWPLDVLNHSVSGAVFHIEKQENGQKLRKLAQDGSDVVTVAVSEKGIAFTHHQRGYNFNIINLEE